VLKVEYKTIEPPKDNEVLVRMLARPINPSDLIPIRGSYSHRISLPNIPGYEGVGIVEDVGPFVSKKLIGKRVLPLRGEGTWQEFVKTSAEFTVLIPNSIDDLRHHRCISIPLQRGWFVQKF
jgi:NADPH:quinone reductase-like Zn-dependent oxidoreductase